VSGPDEKGVSYGTKGQSCPTLVLLKSPIESYSAVPYGQSEKPDSPHFTDQGEKLFAKGLLKPTWFSKVDLLKNIESKKSLSLPA
jgi:acyl-homoserine lactone acylase PvdQ